MEKLKVVGGEVKLKIPGYFGQEVKSGEWELTYMLRTEGEEGSIKY